MKRGEKKTNSRMSVTITSYWMVPRSCDHKMKPLTVRQTPRTGVAAGALLNSAFSVILGPSAKKLRLFALCGEYSMSSTLKLNANS